MLKLGGDVKLESISTWSRCQLGVDANLESMSTWSRCQLGVDVKLESMFKLESMSTLNGMYMILAFPFNTHG